jgi:hypothetical protein
LAKTVPDQRHREEYCARLRKRIEEAKRAQLNLF